MRKLAMDALIRTTLFGIAIFTTLSFSHAATPNPQTNRDVVHWLADRLYPSSEVTSETVLPGETIQGDPVGTVDPESLPQAEAVVQNSGYAALNPSYPVNIWHGGPNWHGPPLWNGQCRHTRIYRSMILGRLWFDAQILGWATKGQDFPALVTTSPGGTPAANAGVDGLGSTSLLFGNETVHDDLRLGGRLTGGWWWDVNQFHGVELHYFGLDGEDIDFRAGAGIIARPFTDANTGTPTSALVNYPGVADGTLRVRADMEFSGAGAHWRRILWGGPRGRVDLVGGYRYLRLYDQLSTLETFESLDPASGFATGLDVERFDRFRTENEFHGGELGLIGRWIRRCWSVELLGKVALGSSRRSLTVDGQTTTVDATDTVTTYGGGLLAQPANLGTFRDSELGYVAEAGASLQYQLTCQSRVYIGYTFIYWDAVSRNGNQINTSIDAGQIPPAGGGGTAANVNFTEDDFWAQGLTAGWTYQF